MKAMSDNVAVPGRAAYAVRKVVAVEWLTAKGIPYLLAIGGGLLFTLPFIWMVSTALKPDDQIFANPPIWMPRELMWENFVRAVNAFPFWVWLRNTLVVAGSTTMMTVLSSSFVAYGFARIAWPGRDMVFWLVLATMMIPYQVIMIPLFIVFKNIGWVNSLKPLIVPAIFGAPFYIFLLRQFFLTIPQELSEAARIDGASELRIYAGIILPLAGPALTTVAIFQFLNAWSDFVTPLIYLSESRLFTLALGLKNFQSQWTTDWSAVMAGSTIMTLPVIVIFLALQKYFIKGVVMSGIKG